MTHAMIFDAVRTPRGKGKKDGSLHEVKPVDLLAGLLVKLQKRHAFDPAQLDDVVMGVVSPVGEQGSVIAKTAALKAGWDVKVAGMQINRFCASGLEAVNIAAQKVASGWEDMVVAGGVESMSRVAIGSDGGAWAQDPATNIATGFVPQGIGADLIATLGGWSRDDVDRYALGSQQRAAAAQAAGHFDRSVLAVDDEIGLALLERDEFIKPRTTLEGLASLKVAFAELGAMGFDAVALARYPQVERIEHVHTAGNSSGIVDGAAAVLIGSEAKGREMGLAPRGRIVATALSGADPTIMLTGPMPATRKVLAKAGLTHRRHRSLRSQRSLRRRADALHARDGRAGGEGQRQRRRDRHGPSARRDRCDARGYAARRARASATQAWVGDLVRRRRHGDRDDRRADLA